MNLKAGRQIVWRRIEKRFPLIELFDYRVHTPLSADPNRHSAAFTNAKRGLLNKLKLFEQIRNLQTGDFGLQAGYSFRENSLKCSVNTHCLPKSKTAPTLPASAKRVRTALFWDKNTKSNSAVHQYHSLERPEKSFKFLQNIFKRSLS